jgi:hypothetical protein
LIVTDEIGSFLFFNPIFLLQSALVLEVTRQLTDASYNMLRFHGDQKELIPHRRVHRSLANALKNFERISRTVGQIIKEEFLTTFNRYFSSKPKGGTLISSYLALTFEEMCCAVTDTLKVCTNLSFISTATNDS